MSHCDNCKLYKKFPFEIKAVEPEMNAKLMRDFPGETEGFLYIGPQKWIFPTKYAEMAEEIYNFDVRPTDVWICGYPRSGTTLMEDILWTLTHDLKIDPDENKTTFFEYDMLASEKRKSQMIAESQYPDQLRQYFKDMDCLKKLKTFQDYRRIIKTHLPFELLPPSLLTCGAKVIFMARNPKDVIVSYYHLHCLERVRNYVGDFPTYVEYFINDLMMFNPYFPYIKQGYDKRNHPNVYFLLYEEMNKNFRGTLEKLSNFLGNPITKEGLDKVENHFSFNNYKKATLHIATNKVKIGVRNENMGSHVRKGKVGGWRDYITDDLNAKVDKWIEKHVNMLGLQFSM